MRSSSSPAAASALHVAAVAALAWGAFLAGSLAARGGDVSRFVVAGDHFADPGRAPAGLYVREGSFGYDGQFYYRLALDPWTDRQDEHGVRLDRPEYRQQRILYPLLVHALALGRPQWVPAALVAVNAACVVLVAGLGAALAGRCGRPAWLGLAFSLYPGLLLAVARDLAEPCEAAAAAAGLLLLGGPRARLAAVFLSLAVLARETAIVLAFAVFLAWLPRPGWLARAAPGARPPAAAWLAPGATFVAWQAWLAARWDVAFLLGTSGRGIERSGLGWLGRLGGALRGEPPQPLVTTLEIGFLLALAAALPLALRASRASLVEKLAAVLLGALLLSRGESVWIEDWAFLRVSSSFWLVALLVLVQAPGRAPLWLAGTGIAGCALLAPHVLARP
jgi:hypothetical protein